jgi:SAM-dependent methyltransferase
MHPTVYNTFRSLIAELKPAGRVLEVGALPDERALLAMPELKDSERVGINLAPPARYDDFEVMHGNGNDMYMFADNSFDLVLSNATLEHDQRFWLTCAEIRRVTKIGGFAVIGVPAFDASTDVVKLGLPRPENIDEEGWNACTLTFRYHGAPYDYYRFTERAMREIFFEIYKLFISQNYDTSAYSRLWQKAGCTIKLFVDPTDFVCPFALAIIKPFEPGCFFQVIETA